MADIDVIIPTHNQTELTVQAIESLAQASERRTVRLIWIDNGSSSEHRRDIYDCIFAMGQETIEYLAPANYGFPKATNIGLALSTAPLVVLMNNDAWMTPAAPWPFDVMADALDRTPGSGLAAPMASSGWQRPEQLAKMGWGVVKDGEFGPSRSTPVVLDREHHPAFFLVMITRRAIQEVGYLTEAVQDGFGEDDDWNERAHAAGFKRLLCLDTFVHHQHRTTWRALYTEREVREKQQQSMGVLQAKYGERVW